MRDLWISGGIEEDFIKDVVMRSTLEVGFVGISL